MNMKLRIRYTEDDRVTWTLWSTGIEISKHLSYRTVPSATKAAKNFAKKQNIIITSCTHYGPENDYEVELKNVL